MGIRRSGQPVCRVKDEPRPICAIVHACSKVASRNGAAGYKLMRPSHATWISTLNPPTTSIRGKRRRDRGSDINPSDRKI